MKWFQWIPLIATAVLFYLLDSFHFSVTHFKVFLLFCVVWSLFLILFYRHTRGHTKESGTN
jgi:Ca2+/Na+ antiporter